MTVPVERARKGKRIMAFDPKIRLANIAVVASETARIE
jgi:hypothetical protein